MRSLILLATIGLSTLSVSAQDLEKPAPKPNPPLAYTATVDPAIPHYRKVSGIHGSLKGVESNTVTDLARAWIENFTKIYPDVKISIDIGGSGQGGPRLTNGTADFGFIAREMMGREETPFVDKFGYHPLAIAVAGGSFKVKAFTDAVGFIVNKDNPLSEISFPQLDAMYSLTHSRGIRKPITTWGQLGLTGEWADKPIHLWGVEIPNGYDNFVNMHVLANGQWRGDIQTQPTVIPLSDKVTADKYAISYTGLAWNTSPGTKVLKLAEREGGPYIEPTFDTIADQTYPLSRVIYIFVHQRPDQPLDPVLREFLLFALSYEGQEAVVHDAIFTPLPARLDAVERAKVH